MAKDKPQPQTGPEIEEYSTTATPKAYAGSVPVFCAHDAIVPLKDLRPNPKNPNQHPPEQIKLLASIIRATGWRAPITVSKRSGLVTKGHGRLMAAQLDDLTDAPVDYQDYASEAEELADLTADNRIAELATTDNKISDSVDSDGCYTVIYNQAPTAPSSITVPSEVLGGENLSISWAASTDPDGNLSGYVLERKVGSGTWAQIYKGSSRSYTDAITYGWTSVQYRVKAYDAAGAESAYTTSATRTVTNNRPPVISGTDGALGSFSTAAPSYEYTVTDADGHQVDVVEMLDGVTLRSYTVTLGHTNTLTIGSEAWLKVVNGSHTLKIVATDAKDASVTRTLTFTKAVTSVEFEQTLAMEADAMPTKALVNIQGNFPAGCTLQVWICNNGNDASPTWEDITQKARTGQKHYFTNQTKTAAAWGVKVKAKLLRGSATETCYIQSIGGNFA